MHENSLAQSVALLPEQERLKELNRLSNQEAEELIYDWEFWARPKQLPPPGDWLIWLILAGRGYGKTRTAGEFVIKEVKANRAKRIALVANTPADARDVMVEGESGILNISPPWFKPVYEPSKRRLTWPNGAIATIYSSKEPDHLNGPQHDLAWGDELRTWYTGQEVWDMLMLGLRLGEHPRCVATSTPLPVKLIKNLIKMPDVVITKGTTYENRSNLAPSFYSQIIARYEGTRLGRQEIEAELLDDNPNALWQRGQIDELRVTQHPDLIRIVVAIDPAVSTGDESADTGIIVAGIAPYMGSLHGYILEDLTIKGTPDQWATAAVTGYYKTKADKIIGEVNNGGDMVEHTIRTVDKAIPFKSVHASRGKYIRAEPVSALYEQGRIHHVGFFPDLEDQLCEWVPGGTSPDRLDALVWALTELMLEEEEPKDGIIIYDAMEHVENMDIV